MRATIVIITRDRPTTLARCLTALEPELVGNESEVIVVDSSRDAGAVDRATQCYPWARVIHIPYERGSMPRQRNVGIRAARGEVVIFIDDDSFVHPGWLDAILSPYTDCSVGGVGGRAILPDFAKSNHKMPSGGWIDLNEFQLPGNFEDATETQIQVEWIVGCNMSFRRAVLFEAGGFDERLVGDYSWEEVDLCTRVRQRGMKLIYDSNAGVDHRLAPRSEVDRISSEPGRFWKANRIYYCLKYFGFRRIFRRLFLQEPYWTVRQIGLRKALVDDLKFRFMGLKLFLRYLKSRKSYPLGARVARSCLNEPKTAARST